MKAKLQPKSAWVVYKESRITELRASEVVVVCKRTGRILYDGQPVTRDRTKVTKNERAQGLGDISRSAGICFGANVVASVASGATSPFWPVIVSAPAPSDFIPPHLAIVNQIGKTVIGSLQTRQTSRVYIEQRASSIMSLTVWIE